jgi:UDP-N-acetylglucosamine diphosphorylase/glucosamine-1-phosphate N-acetyltransferase
MTRSLVVFDDAVARDWRPFTLTRPAGELRFGLLTLRERLERTLESPCLGHLTHPALRDFDEPATPPVLTYDDVPPDRDVLFLCSRAVPDWDAARELPAAPAVVSLDGQPCGYWAPAGSSRPDLDALVELPAAPGTRHVPLPGRLLHDVWQLITHSPSQVMADVRRLFGDRPSSRLPHGVHLLGSQPVVVEEGASLEPGVVLDARDGAIHLGPTSKVEAFSRVVGPSTIGRGTTLLGGSFERISAGPVCKLHGQIEESVVLGYSNKAHDGFLGHAYLGCWVNLGAMTTNSDLKNTYGTVRVWTPAGVRDTGETKLGALIGDHVKTGIGTLIGTGTVIEAGSNIYGAAMPRRYVAPFSWGTGDAMEAYDLDRFLATAGVVMRRRGVALSARQSAMLTAAWQRSRSAARSGGVATP